MYDFFDTTKKADATTAPAFYFLFLSILSVVLAAFTLFDFLLITVAFPLAYIFL